MIRMLDWWNKEFPAISSRHDFIIRIMSVTRGRWSLSHLCRLVEKFLPNCPRWSTNCFATPDQFLQVIWRVWSPQLCRRGTWSEPPTPTTVGGCLRSLSRTKRLPLLWVDVMSYWWCQMSWQTQPPQSDQIPRKYALRLSLSKITSNADQVALFDCLQVFFKLYFSLFINKSLLMMGHSYFWTFSLILEA